MPKFSSFTRDIKDDKNQSSAWTPSVQSLQRRLFKGVVDESEQVYTPDSFGPRLVWLIDSAE